ncbi:MAG: hypothetical protein ACWA5X_13905 [bacterium]
MARITLIAGALLFSGCGNDSALSKTSATDAYLATLEKENGISFSEIKNNRGSYITSMCYTKTRDGSTGIVFNPCYSCHTKGKLPNYYNDTNLQREYNFPQEVRENPFSNLFLDKSVRVAEISDEEILDYVRESNYFYNEEQIALAANLPETWKGYRPDCYFNFDTEGFDHDRAGQYTGWRAFRYTPFLGTFWPTNGSTDDVLIRLAPEFYQTATGALDPGLYDLNLSIVEALVKQVEVPLPTTVDEQTYGVDLNADGMLTSTQRISPNVSSYVGEAKNALVRGELHLAKGLFPEGTEFLHSVRYIDWNEQAGHADIAPRMKELRYARKYGWSTYSQIERTAQAELWELNSLDSNEAQLSVFRGGFEQGLDNQISWVYQGFIEDKGGQLRPQTHEETIECMGCHSHLGATTDSVFAFPRKLAGTVPGDPQYGWGHWTQQGLVGVEEPRVSYQGAGEQYEYSYYLMNNHSGNEFRDNGEVNSKFFSADGNSVEARFEDLHCDISVLLLPSRQRALSLNKAYKTLVEDQSFIYGRDANVAPVKNVYRTRTPEDTTGITHPIIRTQGSNDS